MHSHAYWQGLVDFLCRSLLPVFFTDLFSCLYRSLFSAHLIPGRGLYISKKTCLYINRDLSIKRDLLSSSHHASLPLSYLKETYVYQKRPIHIKTDLYMSKETYTHKTKPLYEKRPTNIKRDLLISSHHASLHISYLERDLHIPKETYIYQKRPKYITRQLYIKRDLYISQETCIYQKRPTYINRDQYI